jgi:hypothetical protein
MYRQSHAAWQLGACRPTGEPPLANSSCPALRTHCECSVKHPNHVCAVVGFTRMAPVSHAVSNEPLTTQPLHPQARSQTGKVTNCWKQGPVWLYSYPSVRCSRLAQSSCRHLPVAVSHASIDAVFSMHDLALGGQCHRGRGGHVDK